MECGVKCDTDIYTLLPDTIGRGPDTNIGLDRICHQGSKPAHEINEQCDMIRSNTSLSMINHSPFLANELQGDLVQQHRKFKCDVLQQ